MKLGIYVFSKIYSAILFIVVVVAVGILGFMYIEGYTISEPIYITVITLSTVGFQEVRELSSLGRLFTTFLIITSFGTFAYAVSALTTYIVIGEFNKYFKDYKVKKDVKQIENHVVVCGYGRNGSQAVKKLFAHEQEFIVIDNKPERIEKIRDINARYETGCNIIGYKTFEVKYVINPKADTPILPNSKLFILGSTKQINHLYRILHIS